MLIALLSFKTRYISQKFSNLTLKGLLYCNSYLLWLWAAQSPLITWDESSTAMFNNFLWIKESVYISLLSWVRKAVTTQNNKRATVCNTWMFYVADCMPVLQLVQFKKLKKCNELAITNNKSPQHTSENN